MKKSFDEYAQRIFAETKHWNENNYKYNMARPYLCMQYLYNGAYYLADYFGSLCLCSKEAFADIPIKEDDPSFVHRIAGIVENALSSPGATVELDWRTVLKNFKDKRECVEIEGEFINPLLLKRAVNVLGATTQVHFSDAENFALHRIPVCMNKYGEIVLVMPCRRNDE